MLPRRGVPSSSNSTPSSPLLPGAGEPLRRPPPGAGDDDRPREAARDGVMLRTGARLRDDEDVDDEDEDEGGDVDEDEDEEF